MRHSIFSDCFAAMAFAQYSKAIKSGGKSEESEWALKIALATFENIEKRKIDPKGRYNKVNNRQIVNYIH